MDHDFLPAAPDIFKKSMKKIEILLYWLYKECKGVYCQHLWKNVKYHSKYTVLYIHFYNLCMLHLLIPVDSIKSIKKFILYTPEIFFVSYNFFIQKITPVDPPRTCVCRSSCSAPWRRRPRRLERPGPRWWPPRASRRPPSTSKRQPSSWKSPPRLFSWDIYR